MGEKPETARNTLFTINDANVLQICLADDTRSRSCSLEGRACCHLTKGSKTEGKPSILQGSFSFIL